MRGRLESGNFVDVSNVLRANTPQGFRSSSSVREKASDRMDGRIISPTSLYNQPTHDGYIGEYTCSLEAKGKVLSISYMLPVSVNDLKAGQFRADVLAEMDYILTSISLER